MYAKLEEEHGLARHAMAVYDRASTSLPPNEQYEVMIYLIPHCYSFRDNFPHYIAKLERLPFERGRVAALLARCEAVLLVCNTNADVKRQ